MDESRATRDPIWVRYMEAGGLQWVVKLQGEGTAPAVDLKKAVVNLQAGRYSEAFEALGKFGPGPTSPDLDLTTVL